MTSSTVKLTTNRSVPAGFQPSSADIVVVGAGAAGLMAGIVAGRTLLERGSRQRVVLLDGAKKIGAKILVAGGGRCNVTHNRVSEDAYAGSSRNAIKKVLRRFDVPQTVAFFREIGVELKHEDSGKLFPTTDDAHTVLTALMEAAHHAGAALHHPRRVETITRAGDMFRIRGAWGEVNAPRVILATGGRSLPKSGSDGHGYVLAQALGHSLTPRVYPALVPLTLPPDHFLCALSGISAEAELEVRAASGKRLAAFRDSTLCTHFGLSGPAVLDISRYYQAALDDDPGASLVINWLPDTPAAELDAALLALGKASPLRVIPLPERLARGLCVSAGVDPTAAAQALTRQSRKALVTAITALRLPIWGTRGYTYAEVTAGGVPLSEIRLETMESRVCPGLYLCGEMCDVDGQIGGYNFQWAWASGYVAGIGAAT